MIALAPLTLALFCPLLDTHEEEGAATNATLGAALEAIDARHIRADLTFLASDELQGRDTPSQGLRMAARYIRARLERLRFQPGGDDGFFDRYELEEAVLDMAATRASVGMADGSIDLVFGEDYYFFSNGIGELLLEAPVVFVGKGTEEEVAGLDLAGRWALVVADQDTISWREREANVKACGAAGLLVAPGPDPEGLDPHARQAERMGRWVARGSLRLTNKPFYPHVFVTRPTTALLWGGTEPAVAPKPGTLLPARFREERRMRADLVVHALENVAGLWPGSDPTLRNEVIVLSAHYDHVGARGGEIFNGADDNGSGTSGLLALAEALNAYGPMRRSVLLLWVSGEEKGLLGSEAWVKEPTLPSGFRAVCNLNIDMIGRNAPDYLLITPTEEHEAYNFLTRMAERTAPLEGFAELGDADGFWGRSDHANFSQHLGIPVAFLFSDVHEDYHQPSDTVDKIDFDKIRRVTRVVMRMLDGLQADSLEG